MSDLKRKSGSELREGARALAETAEASPETIRQIIRRTSGPKTAYLSGLAERLRPDVVLLFVSAVDLSAATAIPTTKLLSRQDALELFGLPWEELRGYGMEEKDGVVRYLELFVAVRSAEIQRIVAREKAAEVNERFKGKLMEDSIRQRFPKAQPNEDAEFRIQRGGS